MPEVFELSVQLHEARHLPNLPRTHCVRVQCVVNGERKDSGPSQWGRGTRSRSAVWPREAAEARRLVWRFDGDSFRQLRSHSPKFKLHAYAASAEAPSARNARIVGTAMLDVASTPRFRRATIALVISTLPHSGLYDSLISRARTHSLFTFSGNFA